MVSRWRRRRQQRRTLRSHRAPRGWRPPPPPDGTDAPDEPIEIGGPGEDSGELTVRRLDAAQATVRLAVGSRAAEDVADEDIPDEGWLAEPDPEEQPPAGRRPRSRRFGRTAAWVVGLIVVAAAAVAMLTHLV